MEMRTRLREIDMLLGQGKCNIRSSELSALYRERKRLNDCLSTKDIPYAITGRRDGVIHENERNAYTLLTCINKIKGELDDK